MPPSTQASETEAKSYELVANSSPAYIRRGSRPEEQLQFEETIVGFFMQAADLLGVPKSIALIYGVIFASPEPLCFADVDERLDISKGSISQGIRVLKEMGAIKTVAKRQAVSSQLLAISSDPKATSSSEAASSNPTVAALLDSRVDRGGSHVAAGLARGDSTVAALLASRVDSNADSRQPTADSSPESTSSSEAPSSKLLAISSDPKATSYQLKATSSSEATSSELKANSYKLIANHDRREFFEPDIQLRQIVQRFLDQKVNRQLELGSQRLTQMREKLPKQNIHHTKILDERVSQLENWHAKTKSLLPVIKTFLKLTSI